MGAETQYVLVGYTVDGKPITVEVSTIFAQPVLFGGKRKLDGETLEAAYRIIGDAPDGKPTAVAETKLLSCPDRWGPKTYRVVVIDPEWMEPREMRVLKYWSKRLATRMAEGESIKKL